MKNIVIVGATGAVGVEMIRCLKELDVPVGRLRLVASERSAGKVIITPFGDIAVEPISEQIFKECDIALFSAGSDISKAWREKVVQSGCVMIDNSSAFRYEKDVPLVAPEINPEAVLKHCGVIANPNCTTAIAAVVIYPLYKAFGLKKMLVSTYQATSGAGEKGMQELLQQTRAVMNGEPVSPLVFSHQIAFNLIPQIDAFQENGYTKEEMKVVWETRKIFGDESLNISCTAVRIPTLRAHSESIVIETEQEISVARAKEILTRTPGVKLVDDVQSRVYPMPLTATGAFDVEVGRIRQSLVFGDYGLELFVCGDQLLKGAALNAVQIAKLLL
jgi:aspartate-semialdehyde dehydrogenase